MDNISALIEALRAKKVLTELESDILETTKELTKHPFNRLSAELRMGLNYTKYADIFVAIGSSSGGTAQPSYTLSDQEIHDNLQQQLLMLASKEWEAQKRS